MNHVVHVTTTKSTVVRYTATWQQWEVKLLWVYNKACQNMHPPWQIWKNHKTLGLPISQANICNGDLLTRTVECWSLHELYTSYNETYQQLALFSFSTLSTIQCFKTQNKRNYPRRFGDRIHLCLQV